MIGALGPGRDSDGPAIGGDDDFGRGLRSFFRLAPFDAEWDELGRGADPEKYRPFSKLERHVPWVLFTLYAGILIFNLFPQICALIGSFT